MSRKPEPLTAELLERICELLQSESTLTLSVLTPAGQPHATPVFYATGEGAGLAPLDLYWLSSESSLHSLALAAHPAAASVAIHRPTFAWREITGLQMRGHCSTVHGAEREAILPRYAERFQLGTVLSLAIHASTLYRFRPTWLRLVDNRVSFGWKAECELVQPESGS